MVNDKTLARAYLRGAKRIAADSGISSTHIDAGTVLQKGKKGQRTGYQVFVRIVRFSEKRLKEKPLSGGLLCEL